MKWVKLNFEQKDLWLDFIDMFENAGYKFMYGVDKKGYTITLTSGYELEDEWCC